jgi:hypothetical protein
MGGHVIIKVLFGPKRLVTNFTRMAFWLFAWTSTRYQNKDENDSISNCKETDLRLQSEEPISERGSDCMEIKILNLPVSQNWKNIHWKKNRNGHSKITKAVCKTCPNFTAFSSHLVRLQQLEMESFSSLFWFICVSEWIGMWSIRLCQSLKSLSHNKHWFELFSKWVVMWSSRFCLDLNGW